MSKKKNTNHKDKMEKDQKDQMVDKEQKEKDTKANQQETLEQDLDNEELLVAETITLKSELEEAKEKYLRLYSEFENYRRRTAKERLDLIGSATEGLMTSLLTILDDFERADKAFNENTDVKAMKEGYDLIYNKFKNITGQKGLKMMEINTGDDFDSEFQEAVTQIPVEDEKLKGKIVEVLEKGYLLNDKVIRFAKVVIGA